MSTYDQGDSAACEFCNLPTCKEKRPGIGYVCELCLTHYEDGTGPTPASDSGQDVAWEHEKLASVVEAVRGYFQRHPEDGRCRAVLRPEGIACTLPVRHDRYTCEDGIVVDHCNVVRLWTDGRPSREGIKEWGFNNPLGRRLEDD